MRSLAVALALLAPMPAFAQSASQPSPNYEAQILMQHFAQTVQALIAAQADNLRLQAEIKALKTHPATAVQTKPGADKESHR